MALRRLAPMVNSFLATVRIASHSLFSIDTNPVPARWQHITKIDPENAKKLPLLYPLYLRHTDALSVGGSQDVTQANSEAVFHLLDHVPTPAFHEPSAARHVTSTTLDQAAFLAIPEVLNGDTESLIGTLGEGVEYIRDELGPELIADTIPIPLSDQTTEKLANFASYWLIHRAVFEAYIIQNPDSAAAREANVTEQDLLAPRQAKQRAMAAERHLESEVIYVEYSGQFGGETAEALVEEISRGVSWARIWYGGGISNAEQSDRMLHAGADAVIVGNVFHDIATAEATVLQQARETFDESPSRDELMTWLETEVDLESTPGTRYLSTIPTVSNPTARAKTYLATTTEIALELDRLVADARTREDPTPAAINKLRSDPRQPTDGLDSEFVESLQTAYLSHHLDSDSPTNFPVSKLSGLDSST